jgi:hypothetical protein
MTAGSATGMMVCIGRTKTGCVGCGPPPSPSLLSSVFYGLIHDCDRALEPHLERKCISREGDSMILKLAN